MRPKSNDTPMNNENCEYHLSVRQAHLTDLTSSKTAAWN